MEERVAPIDRPTDRPMDSHPHTPSNHGTNESDGTQAQGREQEAEADIQLKKAEQATLHKEVSINKGYAYRSVACLSICVCVYVGGEWGWRGGGCPGWRRPSGPPRSIRRCG